MAFSTVTNVPNGQFIESGIENITDAANSISGTLWYVEHGGVFRYNNGTEWTQWYEVNDPAEAIAVVSSLNPVPFQLGMQAGRTSLAEREIVLTAINGLTSQLPWKTIAASKVGDFVPDLFQDNDQIIIDLINHENGTEFTMAQIDIDEAEVYEGIKAADTIAKVKPRPNSGFNTELSVNYSRINVTDFQNPEGAVVVNVPFDGGWDDVIAAVNSQYNINLTPIDYQDEPTFPPVQENFNWTLIINPTSLVYSGVTDLEIHVITYALNTVVTQTSLSGLEFPIP